jgi:hypothetical protein
MEVFTGAKDVEPGETEKTDSSSQRFPLFSAV